MFKWSQGFFNYNLEASNGVCSKTLSFHHQIVEGGKIAGEFETCFFFCSSTALLFLFRKARTVSCGRGRRRRRKHQRDGRENHNIALEPTQQVAKMDVPKSYNKTIYILRRSDNPDFHDCSGLYLRSEYNVRKYFRLHLFDYLSSF